MKHTYSAPKLTLEGSVESLTAAMKIDPKKLDKDFPAGTKSGKLTFS